MQGEILVQYNEVYNQTAEMRQRIESELRDMDAVYRQATQSLRQMDSKTNGIFIEAMEDNRRKAQVTANTLRRLLTFIENSARTIEREEEGITRMFTSTRVSPSRMGGMRNA